MISDYDLEKIVDFIRKHLKYKDKEIIKRYILEHARYKTLDYGKDDNGEIISVVRWNMEDDGKVAHVCDFAIRKDYRRNGLIKTFITRALKGFPNITTIKFRRGIRNDISIHKIDLKSILKESL